MELRESFRAGLARQLGHPSGLRGGLGFPLLVSGK